jgi:hypothetical protein
MSAGCTPQRLAAALPVLAKYPPKPDQHEATSLEHHCSVWATTKPPLGAMTSQVGISTLHNRRLALQH